MDLEKYLGAGEPATLQKFSFYLPDKDRDGRDVEQLGERGQSLVTVPDSD